MWYQPPPFSSPSPSLFLIHFCISETFVMIIWKTFYVFRVLCQYFSWIKTKETISCFYVMEDDLFCSFWRKRSTALLPFTKELQLSPQIQALRVLCLISSCFSRLSFWIRYIAYMWLSMTSNIKFLTQMSNNCSGSFDEIAA